MLRFANLCSKKLDLLLLVALLALEPRNLTPILGYRSRLLSGLRSDFLPRKTANFIFKYDG
jgi:hypothetical protein